MKYSTYLRQVISELESENYSKYICNQHCVMCPSEEQKPHADKLKATIETKLQNYKKKHHMAPGERITLSTVFNSYDEDPSSRIKWLETLARIYESKGR